MEEQVKSGDRNAIFPPHQPLKSQKFGIEIIMLTLLQNGYKQILT